MEALLWAVRAQAEVKGWLEANGGLIVAALAFLGTFATGYWGYKQKKSPTGEAQLDDERMYRQEIRQDNRDLKSEVIELKKVNETLNTQNKQLRQENEHLAEIREKLTKRDTEVANLRESVVELTLKVNELERRRVVHKPEERKNDNEH